MLDEKILRSQITDADWCLGDGEAPITLLEYGDFECPYCAAAAPVLQRIVGDDDAIRLVFRHFPVTTVHPLAQQAAEAAEAAGAQRSFWEMHNLLFAYQPQFELEHLRRLAHSVGLQMGRFDQDMENHAHLPAVKEDFRRGLEDGVNGTPTLFINRVRYDGPREYDAILAAIASLAATRGVS